jgi:Icc-related predicted phosphoesterase
MKFLVLSDKIVTYIYSPIVRSRYNDVDVIIGCGDLSYFYLEYVVSALDKPLFFVRGNHDKVAEYNGNVMRTHPHGGVDVHRKLAKHNGVLLAGVEGSLRYRLGRYQYSQAEMWNHVWSLVPGLIVNRLKYGRYLDVFVTHAPPENIHDQEDLPHQGIRAFRWLIKVFQPVFHFHGHVHVYRPDEITNTKLGRTEVVNSFGIREAVLPRRVKTV